MGVAWNTARSADGSSVCSENAAGRAEKPVLSVYIHIPFCVRKCLYCDFLSHPPAEGEVERYFIGLFGEIESWAKALGSIARQKRSVRSVFFGGGTPSFVRPEYIAECMRRVRECFNILPDAEITLEANPGTLDARKCAVYRAAGINRLSIGLQSADDRELKLLGRIHTWEQFEESFRLAREAGFANINVDVMSALPGQTIESYKETLKKVTSLAPQPPEHISAYSLIIEEGTPFYDIYGGDHDDSLRKSADRDDVSENSAEDFLSEENTEKVTSGKTAARLPSEDAEREMYHFTKEYLASCGYARYEISNYARPGFESRHNTVYWTGGDYLGLGLGASSYVDGRRFSAPDDFSAYLEYAAAEKSLEAHGRQTVREAMEEFMFLGLRMTEGVTEQDFRQSFGLELMDVYGETVKDLTAKGLLTVERENGRTKIALTSRGTDISNAVLSEFLLDG